MRRAGVVLSGRSFSQGGNAKTCSRGRIARVELRQATRSEHGSSWWPKQVCQTWRWALIFGYRRLSWAAGGLDSSRAGWTVFAIVSAGDAWPPKRRTGLWHCLVQERAPEVFRRSWASVNPASRGWSRRPTRGSRSFSATRRMPRSRMSSFSPERDGRTSLAGRGWSLGHAR